jgi:hypothetical protein
MSEQVPSVGRIVHYVSHGSPIRGDGTQAYSRQCRAAIITEILGDPAGTDTMVNLAVLNPQGLFFDHATMHHEAPETEDQAPGGGALNHPGGTWHWPERV